MIHIQIAIDGPAGAGKSTIAKLLAEKLGYIYIDTGAMYRAITLAALQDGITLTDEDSLTRLTSVCKIQLVRGAAGNQEVFLNGQNITKEIRSPLVNQNVSLVAKVPRVREILVHKQQEMAASQSVVMDGRDIGTVVLPLAELKIFLTATLDERASRRYEELLCQNYTGSLEEVRAELKERDYLDSSRDTSPLYAAQDAETIDTTNKTLEDIVAIVIELLQRKAKESEDELL